MTMLNPAGTLYSPERGCQGLGVPGLVKVLLYYCCAVVNHRPYYQKRNEKIGKTTWPEIEKYWSGIMLDANLRAF